MNSDTLTYDFEMKSEVYANRGSDCQIANTDLEEEKQPIQEPSSRRIINFTEEPFDSSYFESTIKSKGQKHIIQRNNHGNEEIIKEKGQILLPNLENGLHEDISADWAKLSDSLSRIPEDQENLLYRHVCYIDGKEEEYVERDLTKRKPGQILSAAQGLLNHYRRCMKNSKGSDQKKTQALKAQKMKEANKDEIDELYLERYKLIKVLGRGAHGFVFKVRDDLNNTWAIKLYKKNDPDAEKLFKREKTPLVMLGSIVSIIETAELYGIRMRAGVGTLKDFKHFIRAKQIKLTEKEVFYILEILLTQLRTVFLIGFAHRDIKPDNVILSSQILYPEIVDFSCAVCFETSEKISALAGTKGYIAPHLFKHNKKMYTKEDLLCGDLFSLGITLLELVISDYQPIQNDPNLEKKLSELSDRPLFSELFNNLLFPPIDSGVEFIEELRKEYCQKEPSNPPLEKYYFGFMEFLGSNVLNKNKTEVKEWKQVLSERPETDANPYFTKAMIELRIMWKTPRESLLNNLKKAANVFREANNSEQELFCYEYLLKSYNTNENKKEASEYVSKCFKMAFDQNVKCNPLLYSALAIYYFLKNDFQPALDMLSIGLARCEDDLSRIILLNNYGCLFWEEGQTENNESLENTYRMIEKNYLEIVSSLISICSSTCVTNKESPISVQYFRIANKSFYEGVLSIKNFDLNGICSESIIWPTLLNVCAFKAYCLVNILKKMDKMASIQNIKDFCYNFDFQKTRESRLQGNLDVYVKLAEFAEIIVSETNEEFLGPNALVELIKQARLFTHKNQLESFCKIFEKNSLDSSSVKELKCKDLLFTMIGLRMMYRDIKSAKKREESQVLEDKLRFLAQFKSSISLSSSNATLEQQISHSNTMIPKRLQPYVKDYHCQIELDKSPNQYLWCLKSVVLNLHLTVNNTEGIMEIAHFMEAIKDTQEITLDLSNSLDLSDEGLLYLTKILSRLNLAHLNINMSSFKFTEEQVVQLAAAISLLDKALKSLEIRFNGSFISTSAIKPLERAIEELKCLNKLNLSFSSCPNFTDALITSLEKVITELPSLKELALKFEACGNMSTDKVKELEARLKSLFESVKIQVSATKLV